MINDKYIIHPENKSCVRYYQSYLTNEKTEKLANFPKIHKRQVLGIHVGAKPQTHTHVQLKFKLKLFPLTFHYFC